MHLPSTLFPAANDTVPPWARNVLLAAALYNILWGAAVVLLPSQTLVLIGIEGLSHLQIWQCVGMIVGVYGVGYAAAAWDPLRHWPIVLVGFLGKVFGPIGFVGGYLQGDLPLRMGWTILTNDLIWWAPFVMILLAAWRGGWKR
jgi:small multidrug resistance pump